jgi:hypothetical protein
MLCKTLRQIGLGELLWSFVPLLVVRAKGEPIADSGFVVGYSTLTQSSWLLNSPGGHFIKPILLQLKPLLLPSVKVSGKIKGFPILSGKSLSTAISVKK